MATGYHARFCLYQAHVIDLLAVFDTKFLALS